MFARATAATPTRSPAVAVRSASPVISTSHSTSAAPMRPVLSIGNTRSARTPEPAEQSQPWYRRAATWLGEAASGAIEFGEDLGWRLLNQFAPELVPIIRQGPLEWLKGRLTEAVEMVFNMLSGPMRPLAGIAGTLMNHFSNLLAWIRAAAARIAQGDCGAITEAVEKIQQVFEGIAAPIVDRIKQLAANVQGFFSGLWERFGAPVWQFLQRLGGQAWEQIQRFGRWIWDKAAPIRNVLARAWTWVKNKLGIGEGPEGQDGILQWVQRKAQEVWDEHIRPFIERHRRPLMVIAGILVMMSPAGPFIAVGAIIGGLIIGIGWIRRHLRTPSGVVNQRDFLRQVIVPGILSAIGRVSTFLTEKARLVADRLTQIVSGLNQAVGAIAGSILDFAVRIFEWLLERFQSLVAWALQGLLRLADWVTDAFDRLRAFLQRVHDVLVEILRVAANIMELPTLLAGRLWNAIPACIRDPFVNYFIPLILRQISFFRELVASPEAWSQTRAEVMTLIRQVFRTFDLWGAMRSAFNLLLRALNVPVDLARQVWQKASQAWDAVLERPIQFLRNIFLAVGQGFGLFFSNILSHLGYGIQGWLFNSVRGMGISPPSSWTDLRAVFGFVLDVLGISLDHVMDLLGRRLMARGVSRAAIGRLRGFVDFLIGAWEWVWVAIDEGPSGLWRMLVERLSNLGQTILESAIGWVMQAIIANVSVRFTALASSAGVGAIVEAFVALYRAIQTAMEYARRILEILDSVFDMVLQIARGVLGPAAELLERGLRMAMPVVIGFLANYLGLGGVGARIREIITNVRARIDLGIEWLIDRALAAGSALLNMLRSGVSAAGAIMQWWRRRQPIQTRSGARHEISVEGELEAPRIVVRSEPRYLDDLVLLVPAARRPEAIDLKDDIIRLMQRGRTRTRDPVRGVDEAGLNSISSEMDNKLRRLGTLLVETGVLGASSISPTALPTPNYTFQTEDGRAGEATVRNLSANRPMGSTPFEDPPGWNYVHASGQVRGRDRFVRMHLINHRLGGLGRAVNLAPGPTESNRLHLDSVETPIKELVGDLPLQAGKTAVVRQYKVSVIYRPRFAIRWPATGSAQINADLASFPETFVCEWNWDGAPASPGPVTGSRIVRVPIGAPLLPDEL